MWALMCIWLVWKCKVKKVYFRRSGKNNHINITVVGLKISWFEFSSNSFNIDVFELISTFNIELSSTKLIEVVIITMTVGKTIQIRCCNSFTWNQTKNIWFSMPTNCIWFPCIAKICHLMVAYGEQLLAWDMLLISAQCLHYRASESMQGM